ncbi:MAG TPA: hypothetical protein VK584_17275 [Streptosporangiaceae bacterium]|nr:hypothetical protein [Streptosporangiaceae bacterium]
MEKTSGQCPSLIGAGRGAVGASWAGDGERAAVAAPGGPGQEAAYLPGARAGGEPVVEVSVAAAGK